MGLKIIPKPKDKIKKRFFIGLDGFSSSTTMAQEDADILIKAKAIKKDKVRYANAQAAMQLRGY